jgi:hypothetical protein
MKSAVDAALLRVISIRRDGSGIIVTFQAVTGRTCRLERKFDIDEATWQPIPVGSDLTANNTGPAQITGASATGFGRAFYRVRLLP